MAFVPYADAKAMGFGTGLPKALSQHSACQGTTAITGSKLNGKPSDTMPYTTRPNIVRQLTGGLQAIFSRIQQRAADARIRKPQPNSSTGAATRGARVATADLNPTSSEWTRSDGFLKVSTSLPLLNYRYRVLRLVGEGTFSQLVVAEDTFAPSPPSQHHLAGMYGSTTINVPATNGEEGETMIPRHRLVALKVMNAKYAFIGIQELDKLLILNQRDQRGWCPIVRVQGPGAFYFQSHLVLVLELLGPALLSYMKTLPRGRVPVEQLRKIALQLVLALGFVSTAGMIHADIKPENVLLEPKGKAVRVKLIDFGNAMTLHEAQAYYEDFEVQTLYYRAPEVVVGVKFNQQIDMWSLGCLLVELATGKPMFNCSGNTQLFQLMQAVLGPCPVAPFASGRFFKQHFSATQQKELHSPRVDSPTFGNENQLIRITNIAKLLHSKDPDFVSFVHGLLEYDPAKRLSSHKALLHPFLSNLFPLTVILGEARPTLFSSLPLSLPRPTSTVHLVSVQRSQEKKQKQQEALMMKRQQEAMLAQQQQQQMMQQQQQQQKVKQQYMQNGVPSSSLSHLQHSPQQFYSNNTYGVQQMPQQQQGNGYASMIKQEPSMKSMGQQMSGPQQQQQWGNQNPMSMQQFQNSSLSNLGMNQQNMYGNNNPNMNWQQQQQQQPRGSHMNNYMTQQNTNNYMQQQQQQQQQQQPFQQQQQNLYQPQQQSALMNMNTYQYGNRYSPQDMNISSPNAGTNAHEASPPHMKRRKGESSTTSVTSSAAVGRSASKKRKHEENNNSPPAAQLMSPVSSLSTLGAAHKQSASPPSTASSSSSGSNKRRITSPSQMTATAAAAMEEEMQGDDSAAVLTDPFLSGQGEAGGDGNEFNLLRTPLSSLSALGGPSGGNVLNSPLFISSPILRSGTPGGHSPVPAPSLPQRDSRTTALSSRAMVGSRRHQDHGIDGNAEEQSANPDEVPPSSLGFIGSSASTAPASSTSGLGLGTGTGRKLGLKNSALSRVAASGVGGSGIQAPLSPLARMGFGIGSPGVAQRELQVSRRGATPSALLERHLHTESPTPSPIDFTARSKLAAAAAATAQLQSANYMGESSDDTSTPIFLPEDPLDLSSGLTSNNTSSAYGDQSDVDQFLSLSPVNHPRQLAAAAANNAAVAAANMNPFANSPVRRPGSIMSHLANQSQTLPTSSLASLGPRSPAPVPIPSYGLGSSSTPTQPKSGLSSRAKVSSLATLPFKASLNDDADSQ